MMRLVRPAVVVPVLGIVLVVLMLIGGRLDRAPVDPVYRPALAAAPFGTVCDPLPPGVRLDLPVQLRADRMLTLPDESVVRRLDLHFDLVDADAAEEAVVSALVDAGFGETTETSPDPDAARQFDRADYGTVALGVRAFDVPDDSIVRGAIALDLPPDSLTPVQVASCTDQQQTKRFPAFDGPPDD